VPLTLEDGFACKLTALEATLAGSAPGAFCVVFMLEDGFACKLTALEAALAGSAPGVFCVAFVLEDGFAAEAMLMPTTSRRKKTST